MWRSYPSVRRGGGKRKRRKQDGGGFPAAGTVFLPLLLGRDRAALTGEEGKGRVGGDGNTGADSSSTLCSPDKVGLRFPPSPSSMAVSLMAESDGNCSFEIYGECQVAEG